MKTIVLKFGGSIISSFDSYYDIANIILERKKQGFRVCVVVSAMNKSTDNLISLAKNLSNNPCLRELDALATTGEVISAALLAILLNEKNIQAISLTGKQAGIITDSNFTDGNILTVSPEFVINLLDDRKIPIIAGFQGVNLNDEVVSLGRGGSDLTAVAIGAALNAEVVEFYKDVPGIYQSSDKLSHSLTSHKTFSNLNYSEALAIIRQGSHQVVCEKALQYAQEHNVKLRVCSVKGVFNECEGTLIGSH